MVNIRKDTCPSHVKQPFLFLSPPSGLVILFLLPVASPLATCFLPFGPVVERRGSSLYMEKLPNA